MKINIKPTRALPREVILKTMQRKSRAVIRVNNGRVEDNDKQFKPS